MHYFGVDQKNKNNKQKNNNHLIFCIDKKEEKKQKYLRKEKFCVLGKANNKTGNCPTTQQALKIAQILFYFL